MNLLIGSAGRRNYLVQWFLEASRRQDPHGMVCAVDASPYAPGLVGADRAQVVPRADTAEHISEIRKCCRDWTISLAFSLNDFESSVWARLPEAPFAEMGIELLTVSPECQAFVEDKASYERVLAKHGLFSPPTFTGRTILQDPERMRTLGDKWIVKNRFGSGSAGMMRCTTDELEACVSYLAPRTTGRSGEPVQSRSQGFANVVVQPQLQGTEFGLDVVSDFSRRYQTVLAREKLRMRSGETDQAVTVDPSPFVELGSALSEVTQHQGLIDVDVLQDAQGRLWVLDINPRFGGGYPFSHVAGADVPACYLAWHAGTEIDPAWLSPQAGVVSSKTELMKVVRGAGTIGRSARSRL